jgi:hypothetical protein
VRFFQKSLEFFQRSVRRVNVVVVGNVVSVVAQGRRTKRQKPDRSYAEVFQVIELLRESAEITDAVGDAVRERADVHLINDGVFVPGWI